MVLGIEPNLPLLLCGHLPRKLLKDIHRRRGTGKGFGLYQVNRAYPKIIKADGTVLVSDQLPLSLAEIQQARPIRKDGSTEPYGPVSNPGLSAG